jgi:hypothetical protein
MYLGYVYPWVCIIVSKIYVFEAWCLISAYIYIIYINVHCMMNVMGFCNICGMDQESSSHALYQCPHAYDLWHSMR